MWAINDIKVYSIYVCVDIVLGIQACLAQFGGNSRLNFCINVCVYVAAVLIKLFTKEGSEQMDEGGGWAVTPPEQGPLLPAELLGPCQSLDFHVKLGCLQERCVWATAEPGAPAAARTGAQQ